MTEPIVRIENLTYDYGKRRALSDLSFNVVSGQIFGLLGPNGGGKTTLFRILSTLLWPFKGRIDISGFDLLTQGKEIRKLLGVVFQSPSLDKKLTIYENMFHQGHLYGLHGKCFKMKIEEMLELVRLADRKKDLVETLSGGLTRRIEIAKALLCAPKLLLLDEPTTGLDPSSRKDIWDYLTILKKNGITSFLTTHLMEEAEKCDQIALLHEGALVAIGEPKLLKKEIGGDILILKSTEVKKLGLAISQKFNIEAKVVEDSVRVEKENGLEFLVELMKSFSNQIESAALSKPTLEDVFIHKTGRKFI